MTNLKQKLNNNEIITIDVRKLLSEIINTDFTIQRAVENAIRERVIDELVKEMKSEFFDEGWDGKKEVKERIMEDLKDSQTKLVKDILREFYESYRYKKSDLSILKKLKEFLGEL